ncbi:MAG: DEAD/DEAH box helicase [Planctomycetes bacterium]|nr:DEAD/DEAH box helicase [Planctomycetota bacterium]
MSLQFKFDPNQLYQIQAIQAVVELFEGQGFVTAHPRFQDGTLNLAVIANQLDLDDGQLLANLLAVQQRNGVRPEGELKRIEKSIQTAQGEAPVAFPNFSVEMETGTGKTYVYLRTAVELFKRYGMRKFIVVVPSLAVREGVLKTLAITEKHFRQLYGNPVYHYYRYDSENLSQVRQFAQSHSVELMVMTIDSFNKASNVIRQEPDRLQGEKPLHLIQAARPILILDEPQNMESEKSVEALADLNPLLALRYSATHRAPSARASAGAGNPTKSAFPGLRTACPDLDINRRVRTRHNASWAFLAMLARRRKLSTKWSLRSPCRGLSPSR